VAQALTTLCTATNGRHNFALKLGVSETDIHLFYAQNAGQSAEVMNTHLLSLWTILQRIALAPPARHTPSEIKIMKELLQTAYGYVATKALHRAKKHLASVTALQEAITPADDFEKNLLRNVFKVAKSANTASALSSSSLLDSREWEVFRACIRILYSFLLSSEYTTSAVAVGRLQEQAKMLKKPLGKQHILHMYLAHSKYDRL
jgi:hypothetical protein